MNGYSLDTNVFIDGRVRWYRPVSFSSLWQNVEALVANERALCPREVSIELGRGDDDCAAWVSAIEDFVCDATDEIVDAVAAISARFPLWVTPEANYADPFVIAHAQVRGWTVVTAERRAGANVPEVNTRIPNVCASLGVDCINLPDLIEREGWTF